MEVSQNVLKYTYSATLAYNGIILIIHFNTQALGVYSETNGLEVFS